MSYDLYFNADSGRRIDNKSFATYFNSRPNFQVANGQAIYQNEDTGVYFLFDDPVDGIVAFNLNYFRPHVFGIEASLELELFARTFDLQCDDPQDDGMGANAKFSTEGFLRGWNQGNCFAFRSMLKERLDQTIFTWPSQRIRDVWQWNYTRSASQEKAGEEIFLPSIMALELAGKPLAIAVWPPQCPVLMPEVDAVLVPLSQTGKRSEEVSIVPWAEIAPLVEPDQDESSDCPRYRLPIDTPQVRAFLQNKRTPLAEIKGIPTDQLLDQELVDEAREAAK